MDEVRWRERVRSARIESLRVELEKNPGAVGPFWESLGEQGAPLVEAIPGEEDARCVTFVYRDQSGELDHVALCRFIVLNDYADNLLRRVGNSDLLALSLRLPANTRTEYLLSPNDPLTQVTGANLAERVARWRPDPLNPRLIRLQCSEWRPEGLSQVSLLELPAAVRRVWTRTPGESDRPPDLNLRVDQPVEGDSGRRLWTQRIGGGPPCGLVVVLDGWNSIHHQNTPLALHRLHCAGLLPPTAVVYVDSGTAEMRRRDYLGSPEYSAYLANEVVPMVARSLGVELSFRRVVICGMSAGGFTALTTAFRYPDVFGGVLAISAPAAFTADALPQGVIGLAARVPRGLRPRVQLQAGLLEVDMTHPATNGQILGSNRRLHRDLKAMGFDVTLHEQPCGHGMTDFAESFATGLPQLLTPGPTPSP